MLELDVVRIVGNTYRQGAVLIENWNITNIWYFVTTVESSHPYLLLKEPFLDHAQALILRK